MDMDSEGIVKNALYSLKRQPVGETPAGLDKAVRALPEWMVRLAVARQWATPAAGLLVGGLALFGLLHWSAPMNANLRTGVVAETQTLTSGTTLVAEAGQMIKMDLAQETGRLELIGPAALVVREASIGRIRSDHKLLLDLAHGKTRIWFGTNAPAHDVQIWTSQAIVRLSGTDVLVQATPATTRVEILEGQAEVESLATGRQQVVTAGQTIQIQAAQMTIQDEMPQELEVEHPLTDDVPGEGIRRPLTWIEDKDA